MERFLLLLDELEDCLFCLPMMWPRLRGPLLLGGLAVAAAGVLTMQAPSATTAASLLLPMLLG